MSLHFEVTHSNALPRPPGRRRLDADTPCQGCGKVMKARSNAYELLNDEQPGAMWHKRCLHGRQTSRPEGRPSWQGLRYGSRTVATFSSTCNVCRKDIDIGDPIVVLADHRWAHVSCVPGARPATSPKATNSSRRTTASGSSRRAS